MKNKKGFTLVEVIIASCILVVALIPLMGSFVFSSRLNVKGRQREQAMVVAENIMEGIKAVGPLNATKWATGNTTYSVIPNNLGLTKSGLEYNDTTKKDFSAYALANGETLGSEYNALEVKLKSYCIKLDNILMGKTNYDAYVVIEQKAEDNTNMLAYALEGKFEGAGIVKYYSVKVYVVADGGFDGQTMPELKTDNANQTRLEAFASTLETLSLAQYQGTVITQS